LTWEIANLCFSYKSKEIEFFHQLRNAYQFPKRIFFVTHESDIVSDNYLNLKITYYGAAIGFSFYQIQRILFSYYHYNLQIMTTSYQNDILTEKKFEIVWYYIYDSIHSSFFASKEILLYLKET
jgi:hypothetical protein